MLSSRQQQCLQGIGVRLWRNRSSADAIPLADETVAAPAAAEIIAATATQISELMKPGSSIRGDAPAPDKPEPATRQAFEIPLLDSWDVITDTRNLLGTVLRQFTGVALMYRIGDDVPVVE